jgi:hypothetical protein
MAVANSREGIMKRRVLSGLLLALGGLSLILLSASSRGQEPPAHVTCPPLPEQGPANQVSIYVAKALDAPGVVCARVINGFSASIVGAVGYLRLQKWEEGRFRDLEELLSGGAPILMTADRPAMPPGATIEHRLPLSGQPAPPGRYRVCFGSIPPSAEPTELFG